MWGCWDSANAPCDTGTSPDGPGGFSIFYCLRRHIISHLPAISKCSTLAVMELGKAKLLRTGLNALHQAIHPVHGLAWTDGKQVILTALHLQNGEPKFGDSSVVGQFEHVHGLYWGPCPAEAPALLAVQHKKHITIWQLCFNGADRNKLLVSQICDISEPYPVLPQGCVWHPSKEVLAVLTTRDASVLPSVHLSNSRINADIKGSGLIHCACWTKEGNRLVVGVGSALHSYIWDDAQGTLSACSFCPIFDVGGYICAVEATQNLQVAVATELPLDKICGLNAGVAFEVPASVETESFPSQSSLCGEEEYSLDGGKKSLDSEKPLSDKYMIRLMIKELILEIGPSKSVSADGSSSLNLSNITHDPSRDVSVLSRGLLIPDRSALQSPTSRRKLIEEIKSSVYEQNLVLNISDFKDKKISMNFPPAVETLDAEPVNRSVALSNASNKPTSPKRQPEAASKIPNSYKNNLFSEKEASYFLKNVEKLSATFTELQHHLSELTELLKSGKRSLPVYPSSQEPLFINITCQKQLSKSDADESRAVLLCGGSSWIVLTADSEGFIPLTFTSTQEILIRDATAKGYSSHSSKTLDIISSTQGCRSTSSESLDITSSLEVLRDCSSKTLDSISPSEQPSNKIFGEVIATCLIFCDENIQLKLFFHAYKSLWEFRSCPFCLLGQLSRAEALPGVWRGCSFASSHTDISKHFCALRLIIQHGQQQWELLNLLDVDMCRFYSMTLKVTKKRVYFGNTGEVKSSWAAASLNRNFSANVFQQGLTDAVPKSRPTKKFSASLANKRLSNPSKELNNSPGLLKKNDSSKKIHTCYDPCCNHRHQPTLEWKKTGAVFVCGHLGKGKGV
ncbi:hypothetical protein IHE44_0009751 [Lamprotornis superbus]|uniref:WD repeat and coiled-coil-containing protein n=1 Tax=Lamprotornis superbus TaxID=245042 RepID=A0A835P1G1_9PASS|nr:hypothetical protein IHE44_0009751 [Lamprotornis superbus]